MLLIYGVLMACAIVVLLALIGIWLQRREIVRLRAQQQAWEKAQEVRHQHWEEQQRKQFLDLESTLVHNIEETAQLERRRIELEQSRVVDELASLPRIEDTPLPPSDTQNQIISKDGDYRAHSFQNAYLANTNLSYRYLRNADLRDTNLSHANLFMADLTGACLRGANLNDADLTAANLSFADLTDATLSGANLLVADLDHTVLIGANLIEARQLTQDQLKNAITDKTTRLDKINTGTHTPPPSTPDPHSAERKDEEDHRNTPTSVA